MSSKNRINIGGDPNDTNYRYWMPPLKTKIEGRGNGIKTVVTNITEVSKKLQTEPLYITKFFGIEFNAASNYNKNRNVGIINGRHQSKDFQAHLTKFIKDFILCPKCGLPELKTKIGQKKILQKCESCGTKVINKSTHKVRKIIINYATAKKTGKKSSKKPLKKDVRVDEKTPDAIVQNVSGIQSSETWHVDANLDEIAHIKQQNMNRLALKNQQEQKQNDEKLPQIMDTESAAAILRKYVRFGKAQYELLNEINIIAKAKNYNIKKKLVFVLEALCSFDDLNGFLGCIKGYKVIFQSLSGNINENDIQIFLGVLQEFICKRNLPSEFMNKYYKVLECLYDEEICEESDLLLWADQPLDKALFVSRDEIEEVKSKAEVFIAWLKGNDNNEEENE